MLLVVFEGTSGIDNKYTTVQFTGEEAPVQAYYSTRKSETEVLMVLHSMTYRVKRERAASTAPCAYMSGDASHDFLSIGDEHGEKMSLLALWIKAHTGKNGSFLPGTVTEDFLEDEAFELTMHGGEIPDRPIGYELGVRKSDIYGVHALLRKDGSRRIKQRTDMCPYNPNYNDPAKGPNTYQLPEHLPFCKQEECSSICIHELILEMQCLL
uniref:Uncharacterized protein n=1 Tax=Chenopodium quinoa TaxID=63459 RepID=A0A803N3V2_CHEQI